MSVLSRVLALASSLVLGAQALGQGGTFVDTELPMQLGQATGLMFAPDGRGFIWEKAGYVKTFDNDVLYPTPLVDIHEESGDWRDFGLVGFTIDPNYLTNGRVYLFYVVDYHYLAFYGTPQYDPNLIAGYHDTIGRITRYDCNPANGFRTVLPASRTIIMGETITTGSAVTHESHGVGSLLFGEDGSLIASMGDGSSYDAADIGGFRTNSSNTALADGIIKPKEDVGSYRSQLVDSFSGKILRMDPVTGNGLPNNPFYDASAPHAPRSRVWALGLRNPFRMALRPGSGNASSPGMIVVGDVGWEDWEELNVVTAPGQNFGWPIYEGHDVCTRYPASSPFNQDALNPLFGTGGCTQQYFRFTDLIKQDSLNAPSFPNPCNTSQQIPASVPKFVHRRAALDWKHGPPNQVRVPTYTGNNASTKNLGSAGCPVVGSPFPGTASVGGVWYTGSMFPAMYQGTYFHSDYTGRWIKNLVFDSNQNLLEVRPFLDFIEEVGPVTCVAMHPITGALYYTAYNEWGVCKIHKVTFVPNAPPVVAVTTNRINGPLPLSVQFDTFGTYDPEGGLLTYHWDFGDGTTSTNAFPLHVYANTTSNPIHFDVVLTVTDDDNQSTVRHIDIWGNNTAPTATITSPAQPITYFRPNIAAFMQPMVGVASDAQTPSGQLSCQWQSVIHHNTHTHPEPPENTCSTQTQVGPHGLPDEVFYFELRFTVTDPQGMSTSAVAEFRPACPSDLSGPTLGQPDGGTDIGDLLYFLARFEAGDIAGADLDNGTFTGTTDGGVDIGDLLFFLDHFEGGC